jgi:hypothetical protein
MLRYASYQTACDIATATFLVFWILTRHVLFGGVMWSAYHAPALIPYAWIPEQKYWFTQQVYIVFVALLVVLQVRAIGRLYTHATDEDPAGHSVPMVVHDLRHCMADRVRPGRRRHAERRRGVCVCRYTPVFPR